MEREKYLSDYFEVLKERWIVVLIIPLIVTITSGIINYYLNAKPFYLATTTLVLGNPNELSQKNEHVYEFDVNTILAGPKLVKIFEPIVKSRTVEQNVIDELNLPLSVELLNSRVNVNSVQDSDLISISIKDNNANLAADIANSLAKEFSKVVVAIKKVDTVTVLDRAVSPQEPIKVNLMRNILYTYFVSLIIAIWLALFLDYQDHTIKNPEEVQKGLKLPVIGIIPYDSKTLFDSKSSVAEAYRTLRTNIQFISPSNVKKKILITSTVSGEGKSAMVVNLGISLVQTGNRVLIIDANLRQPIQHKLMEISNNEGLSNTLVSESPGLENIVQTQIKKLDILTAGPIPLNPAELLASSNMKSILAAAELVYDVVILDSSPSLAIADVSILAQLVNMVILVVGYREVSREKALEAKEQLDKVEANLIGVVLNKVDVKNKDNYYNYRKGSSKKIKLFKRSKFQNPSSQISV